jgi:peptidoglycan/LPS O-acetylase OafA/YrhL
MNLVPVKRTYYNGLDAFRGIAILMVVAYHCFDYVGAVKFGWLGVDLFFVLSGFLITDLILTVKKHPNFLKTFYIRRALRILPLYYLSVFTFLIIGSFLFHEQGTGSTFGYYFKNQTWFWLYIQNWQFVLYGKPPMPYLSHFWSLAVEEQYYILWPIIILFIRRMRTLKTLIFSLIILAVFIRCAIYFRENTWVEQYYENTIARMDSLLIGSLLAVRKKENKRLSFPSLMLIAISTLVLISVSLILEGNIYQDSLINATIGYTIYDLMFAGIIYIFLNCNHSIIKVISDIKILNYLGKISYGVYVFHLPAYLILSTKLSHIAYQIISNNYYTKIYISVFSIGITITISIISFYLIETPILRLKKKFKYEKLDKLLSYQLQN